MRILHIVTLVTPDGSLGGPLRVAVNLMKSLKDKGHEVLLVAAAQGYQSSFPDTYDGVPVKLFPAYSVIPGTGFAGLTSPGLFAWLYKSATTADIIHVHMARDLVTLPAALVAQAMGVPTVVHTHGMIDSSDRILAKPLDCLMTRRALRGAAQIIALTEQEKQDLLLVDPYLQASAIQILRNGVPLSELEAVHITESPEVLFLARLQERKRPTVFVHVAQQLAREFPRAHFCLIGPDEGQGEAVLELLAHDNADGRIRWQGSLPADQTIARMAQAQIYVLPAVEEPYGMTVIEAMTVGLPVVVMDDCGLAPEVKQFGAGLVAHNDDLDSLVTAVGSLLKDADIRACMGAHGKDFVVEFCSMPKIVEQLESIYRKVSC